MTSDVANLSKLIFSLFLAIGLLCSVANALAQTTASVTIPFAFSANNQYVAAGTYKLKLLSDRFLSFRNTATNEIQVLMVRPAVGPDIETRGRLVFHREGQRNYLAQVWIAGTSVHSEMTVQPRPEQTLAQTLQEAGTIEIAMK
jgi:hypothetical protein